MTNNPQQLDVATLARYLEGHVPGFKGPVSAEKFGGGQSNPTFLLTAGSGRYVLRRQPPGELLSPHMRWIANSGFWLPCPVPGCR